MPSSPLCDQLLDVVFPCLGTVLVEQVEVVDGTVRISARTREDVALPCPSCGAVSGRVHSRYRRRVADAAVGGRPVVIDLSVRRLFCDADRCQRRTFVEQVDGLTVRYGRYTPLLLGVLQAVGLALAGRAGARLLVELRAVVSRVTLLSLVMALPDPPPVTPRVLGVDDFALRRGHVYGTVLVDGETHRPVELLPGRDADPLAAWLSAHPGVTVICRDRAGAYDEGGHRGAPKATHVADRWHLWHNLGQHVEKDVAAHRGCLRQVAVAKPVDPAAIEALAPQALSAQGALEARTRRRWREIHALADDGWAVSEIARELHLGRSTVRRFLRAEQVDAVLGHIAGRRPSVLDPWRDYLSRRWDEGCRSATVLRRELAERGLECSIRLLTRYLRTMQVSGTIRASGPEPPTTRALVGLLMRPFGALDDDQQHQLKTALAACPQLDALARHVRIFARILTKRQGATGLREWVLAVRADDLPALKAFAAGLEKDWSAVVAGVTLAWSSGMVEGTVTKIKMVKRQMYGRAGLPLLRKRVLLL
ncbi:ISL3 family transposase [Streptomycetaceae bacterium NBC_01309]